jgi:hypothetical protein
VRIPDDEFALGSDDDVDAEFTQPPADRVRAAFGPQPFGDTLGEVIEGVQSAEAVLFDSAEQIPMNRGTTGACSSSAIPPGARRYPLAWAFQPVLLVPTSWA